MNRTWTSELAEVGIKFRIRLSVLCSYLFPVVKSILSEFSIISAIRQALLLNEMESVKKLIKFLNQYIYIFDSNPNK